MKDFMKSVNDLVDKPLGYLLLLFSFFYLIFSRGDIRLGYYTLVYASANITFRLFWKDSRKYIFNKEDRKEPNWLYHLVQTTMLIIWATLVFINL